MGRVFGTGRVAAGMIVLGLAAGIAVPVLAHGGSSGRRLFESALAGSTPGFEVRGAPSGAVAWTLDRHHSRARIDESGRLRVRVEGLVITGTGSDLDGTTGPVEEVAASLTCEGGGSVSTPSESLSEDGEARIREEVSLPGPCIGPIVLVRANGPDGPWIAATGL